MARRPSFVVVGLVAGALAVACGVSSSGEAVPVPSADAGPDAPGAETGPVEASTDAGLDALADGSDAGDARDASDADAGDPPTVVVGAPDRILLLGTVVTPDLSFEGQVLVEGTNITCVLPGTACAAEPGAAGATVIDTKGVIAPGLIDTHNHILFDVFDDSDWLPMQVYTNHDQWPNEPRYAAMLDVKQCLANDSQGKPAWCANTPYGTAAGSLRCEMNKWGELKGLVAGTTSIVGLAGTSQGCYASLARSLDQPQNRLGTDTMQVSALFPPSRSSADGVCANFADGDTTAYLIHCGEGTDANALAEFAQLGAASTTPQCLYAPQTAITHGTAFGANEFAQMAASGMKLVWSPKSNVALYGATTQIPLAVDANVTIALAPDWSMGGSTNLLDEMRFADTWDNANFGNRLSAKDLVRMTTKNAATVVALSDRIGELAPNRLADLFVVPKTGADPWQSILDARPKTVRLTMVGGRIVYGDLPIQPAAPALPGCETIDVCGATKFVCVAEASANDKLSQTFVEIKTALEAGMVAVDAETPGDGYSFAPLAPLAKCN